MSARYYDDFGTNQNIEETESRIRILLMAAILAAAFYGGMGLGSMVTDGLGSL